MSLRNGDVFAGYKIVRQLGSGGMGEVYLAEHPRLPRRDALKLLPAALTNDDGYRARFHREADLASTLWHPHIVGVHDRGETDGQLWIAMDFVDGVDASQLLTQRYPNGMPADLVVRIVSAVAAALDHAHKKGMLHRDVKPANILLTRINDDIAEQRILLADFGIARDVGEVSGITTTNMTVGTVAYAAPEQLMGEDPDGRCDQYALAATAYHLLTGTTLFPHSSPAVVISRHLNAAPPPVSAMRPDLHDLDVVLAAALNKRPADRFLRCQLFAQALAEPVAASIPAAIAPTKSAVAVTPPSAPTQRAKVAKKQAETEVSSALGSDFAKPSGHGILKVALAVLAAALLVSGIGLAVFWPRSNVPKELESASSTSVVQTPPVAPPPSVATAQTPSSTPTTKPPEDPRLSGPVTGSPCGSQDWNVTDVSREGTSVRCTKSTDNDYSWTTDNGEQLDPAVIAEIGWDTCNQRYTAASCVAAAQQIVGAPSSSIPVVADGQWPVPNFVKYGTHAAVVGPSGTCWWYGYGSNGTIVDSGHIIGQGERAEAFVSPFMTVFQTVGCTPWVLVADLPANY